MIKEIWRDWLCDEACYKSPFFPAFKHIPRQRKSSVKKGYHVLFMFSFLCIKRDLEQLTGICALAEAHKCFYKLCLHSV